MKKYYKDKLNKICLQIFLLSRSSAECTTNCKKNCQVIGKKYDFIISYRKIPNLNQGLASWGQGCVFICISFSRSNRNIGLRIRNICDLHRQQKGHNYLGRCNYLKDWDGLLLLCTCTTTNNNHHLSLSFNSKMTFQTLRLVNSSFSVKITGSNHQS